MSDEDQGTKPLKLAKKTGKKARQSDKKWMGLVLLVTILLSLGFYFFAGRGMEEMRVKLESRSVKKMEKLEEVEPVKVESLKKSVWDKLGEMWGPAVYEF